MSREQPDLFGDDPPALFDENAPTPVFKPDPERVRRRLHRILAEARAAQTLPWDSPTLSLYRTIFPQMSFALPEDEGAQFRFQFEEALERLKAA